MYRSLCLLISISKTCISFWLQVILCQHSSDLSFALFISVLRQKGHFSSITSWYSYEPENIWPWTWDAQMRHLSVVLESVCFSRSDQLWGCICICVRPEKLGNVFRIIPKGRNWHFIYMTMALPPRLGLLLLCGCVFCRDPVCRVLARLLGVF